ncbi:progestin and adipoQ receptor family member 4a isoform X4 [Nerophis lumbriciformis]|uniref:progestin and adipoQ receptor family member 4a isoform X4 n=1 Tax=Nerophis lumbriciformis TaxID=546530 RepID=UPI002ADFE4D3|nr:progestin and adipoQ receptor family member 4-like isoform X4 [Nerophis lumbriciformis]
MLSHKVLVAILLLNVYVGVQSVYYFFGGVLLAVVCAMAFLNGPRLLDWASSPPYLQFNKYVLTGYRPVSSVQDCIRSLFYLHNELGNIYTHGALPILYSTLLCYPLIRMVALAVYILLSSHAIYCAVTARSSVRRLRSFAWQALFRFSFFLMRWAGVGGGSPNSLRHFLTMDALAVLGGVINIARIPERFRPGLFDYWCNSHQIMHVLVVGSILYLHWGVLDDLLWINSYNCPSD